MFRNIDNAALVDGVEVVILFVLGRGPKGTAPGRLYLMNDTFILPTKKTYTSLMLPAKRELIDITGAWFYYNRTERRIYICTYACISCLKRSCIKLMSKIRAVQQGHLPETECDDLSSFTIYRFNDHCRPLHGFRSRWVSETKKKKKPKERTTSKKINKMPLSLQKHGSRGRARTRVPQRLLPRRISRACLLCTKGCQRKTKVQWQNL